MRATPSSYGNHRSSHSKGGLVVAAIPITAGQVITAPLLNSRLPTSAMTVGSNGNNTTETVIGQLSLPANDAAANSVYHIVIKGNITSGGVTNSMTWRMRFDNAAGTSLFNQSLAHTPSTINTTSGWFVDCYLACLVSGIGGVWDFFGTLSSLAAAATGSSGFVDPVCTPNQLSHDTTVAIPLVVTTKWGGTSTGQASATSSGTCVRIA